LAPYYAERLSGERLRRCYEIAPPRVKRYLEAEIGHVVERLRPDDTVLELGCGYGRISGRLAGIARRVVGIDTARASLELARRIGGGGARCAYLLMDAADLHFRDRSFDAVVCLQNGICAFGVDPSTLLKEALRVTRRGGLVLFSTYSDGIWPERLAWFEAQAAEGLVGEIDRTRSRAGEIVCRDGFRAGRLTPAEFRSLASEVVAMPEIVEVDGSSVFCEIVAGGESLRSRRRGDP